MGGWVKISGGAEYAGVSVRAFRVWINNTLGCIVVCRERNLDPVG